MDIICSDIHHQHDLEMEMLTEGPVPCFERAARVDNVMQAIERRRFGNLVSPTEHGLEPVTRIHNAEYLGFLETAWQDWHARYPHLDSTGLYCFPSRDPDAKVPEHIAARLGYYSFDLSAALTAGSWRAIRESADIALTGVDRVLAGERSVFSLCRPPGHHASADRMGGYCYINNAAVAAQAFLDAGKSRVAIIDVDYHHGNGTQEIFYERSDVYYLSIHGHPDQEYPHYWGWSDETGRGAGHGYNLNFPLHLGETDWSVYRKALEQCLATANDFTADVLIVSLGLDTYENDPMCEFKLSQPDYGDMGEMIAKSYGGPVLFAFEGGYCIEDLGDNTLNVLAGFESVSR